MKLLKYLFLTSIIAIFYSTQIEPSDYDAKKFVFQKLDKIAKYQMFTRGTIGEKTIFDIAFPLVQQNMPEEDIFNSIKRINEFFTYQGNKESVQDHKNFLIGKITGFIDALKNQLEMFYVLQPGMLVIAQDQEQHLPNSPQQEPKQLHPYIADEWNPEPQIPLAITDKDVQWTEEEFIIELDYYIMKYMEAKHKSPQLSDFMDWLNSYYKDVSTGREFATWITKRINPFSTSRQAKAELQFTPDSILFFILNYIPKMLISQDQKRSNIDWQTLKKVFPGFIIYDDTSLFRFAKDRITQKTIEFLIAMINENLKKLTSDKSIGQVVVFEQGHHQKNEHFMQKNKDILMQALELAELLV